MGKAFSESESAMIKQKLIESCRICWDKYGYKKTGISELARMAGISAGAFYAFFDSKEILFIETSNYYTDEILKKVKATIPKQPTKYEFASGLKVLMRELISNRWLFSLRDDMQLFLRKLPPDFMENNWKNDLLNFQSLIDEYGLTIKVSIESFTSVISILTMSMYYPEFIGDSYFEAIDLLIDGVIEKIMI